MRRRARRMRSGTNRDTNSSNPFVLACPSEGPRWSRTFWSQYTGSLNTVPTSPLRPCSIRPKLQLLAIGSYHAGYDCTIILHRRRYVLCWWLDPQIIGVVGYIGGREPRCVRCSSLPVEDGAPGPVETYPRQILPDIFFSDAAQTATS